VTENLPNERNITLGTEEIDVILELQLKNTVLVDAIRSTRQTNNVAKQRQAGQGIIILQHYKVKGKGKGKGTHSQHRSLTALWP